MASVLEFRGNTGQAQSELEKVARTQERIEKTTAKARLAAQAQNKQVAALGHENKRLADRTRDLERVQSRQGRTAREHWLAQSAAVKRVDAGVGLLATRLLGAVTAAVSIRQGVAAYGELANRLDSIKRKADEAASSLLGLALVSPGQRFDAASRAIAVQGARSGVAHAQSFAVGQTAAAVFEPAMQARARQEQFDLMRLGVAQQEAGEVIAFGKNLGLSPEQASALALRAAEASVVTPGQFAPVFPRLGGFRDASTGAAIASVLSQSTEAGLLPEATARTATALFGENKLNAALAQRVPGFADMGAVERLAAIQANVTDVSPAGLQRAGLNEEQSRELAKIFRTGVAEVARQADTIRRTPADFSDTLIARTLAASPILRAADESRRRLAATGVERLFGEAAPAAREMMASRERMGGLLARRGADAHLFGSMLLDDEGRAGPITTAVMGGLAQRRRALGDMSPEVSETLTAAGESQRIGGNPFSRLERLHPVINALASALDRNSAALERGQSRNPMARGAE